jgi:HAE1 family hydrophobic/amphiphilic exporter-1
MVVVTVLSPIPLFAGELLKVDMFPQDASDRLQLVYHIEGSYPLERIERGVDRVEAYLEENKERFGIELVYSYYTPDYAASVIKLKPREELPMTARELMVEIEKGMPEIIIGKPSFRFEDNQGGSSGFSLRLSGESTERLIELSRDVVSMLSQIEGFDSVRSLARAGEQEVQVRVDRARAAQLGLSAQIVAQTVAGAMRGDRLKEFRSDEREVQMRLAFRPNDRQSIDDLAATPLFLPNGERSTLGAVASFHIEKTERAIERFDRLTAINIEGIVSEDSSLNEVRKRTEAAMKEYQLPPGYSWQFGKGIDDDQEAMQDMLVNIALAIVLIFLVMSSLFESTLYPVSIVTSIVFAVVGVFWGLTLSGTPLTFMAMLGIMILIGVIVNIGIVLVAHILDLRRQGLPRDQAILQAARDRLRPILMTTLTTLLAMLPLALGDAQIGGGGPAYFPMARALISGLTFGAVTSLFFVPAFYVWLDNFTAWRRRLSAATRPEPAAASAATR